MVKILSLADSLSNTYSKYKTRWFYSYMKECHDLFFTVLYSVQCTVMHCTAHCTVLYCTCSSQAAPSRYRPVSPVPSAGTSSPVCTDHYRDTALLLPSSGQSEDKRKVTKSPGDPVYFGLLYYCISGFNAGKG